MVWVYHLDHLHMEWNKAFQVVILTNKEYGSDHASSGMGRQSPHISGTCAHLSVATVHVAIARVEKARRRYQHLNHQPQYLVSVGSIRQGRKRCKRCI
jgi:hypothetical protein